MMANGATLTSSDQRDRDVLQAVLLRLLTDSEFNMTRASSNAAVIVLHSRTSQKTGFLQTHQMRSDIGKHTLPKEAEKDLQERNSPRNPRPDTYDAINSSFANFPFATNILVADLTGKMGSLLYREFRKAYPNACGWVEAYLPGYSKDGRTAVVRALVGPWTHAASVTAVLEKSGEKWNVKWHHIAFYA